MFEENKKTSGNVKKLDKKIFEYKKNQNYPLADTSKAHIWLCSLESINTSSKFLLFFMQFIFFNKFDEFMHFFAEPILFNISSSY